MATEDTIQDLIRLDRLYFRALRSSYAKTTFYMNRKELLVLNISTVKELKLFDEGSWVAHVSRVKWNQQEAGKAEVIYRTDLLRMAKAGDLEHIPGKAEVDKVYFKTACPLLIISIRERLQELRLSVESDISAKILAMCEWPGRDIINSINLNAQDTDVLMKINRIEEKHLSCFRMLKRVFQDGRPKSITKQAGKQEVITLTKAQVEMLDWFNEIFPQIDFATNGPPDSRRRSPKTNQESAKVLESYGLIQRPEGKTKGHIITDKGKEYFNKHYC